MKYLAASTIMIFWMIASVLLTISVIGIIVLIDKDSYWSRIPNKLLSVFES